MRPHEDHSMADSRNLTSLDREYQEGMRGYFPRSIGSDLDKLRNFTKYVSRQALAAFLAKSSIFQNILHIHGNIIECGVHLGGGMLTWANLSSIYEPINHNRRIVGFDTFEGFINFSAEDRLSSVPYARPKGLAVDSFDDISECIDLFDKNRPIGHISKLELVRGDATSTIPKYLESNPHTVVSLLYLDFDLYEPTKVALENFLPRMPKGSVIAFDELNQQAWPGETKAVIDTVGLSNLRIRRFPETPAISYAIIE